MGNRECVEAPDAAEPWAIDEVAALQNQAGNQAAHAVRQEDDFLIAPNGGSIDGLSKQIGVAPKIAAPIVAERNSSVRRVRDSISVFKAGFFDDGADWLVNAHATVDHVDNSPRQQR